MSKYYKLLLTLYASTSMYCACTITFPCSFHRTTHQAMYSVTGKNYHAVEQNYGYGMRSGIGMVDGV